MEKYTNKLSLIITGLIIFLSFYIPDIGFRIILNNYNNYYSILEISPNLFTLSFIFLFIGIYFLINSKLKKFIYIVLNFINVLIIYFEYLHFKCYSTIFSNHLFDDITKLISYTDYKIVIICILSILISLLIIFFDNYNKNYSFNQVILIVLSTILISGSLHGLAIISLGPEVISISGKRIDSAKNIYLDKTDIIKNIQISGIYENNLSKLNNIINNKIDTNNKKIIENYNDF